MHSIITNNYKMKLQSEIVELHSDVYLSTVFKKKKKKVGKATCLINDEDHNPIIQPQIVQSYNKYMRPHSLPNLCFAHIFKPLITSRDIDIQVNNFFIIFLPFLKNNFFLTFILR